MGPDWTEYDDSQPAPAAPPPVQRPVAAQDELPTELPPMTMARATAAAAPSAPRARAGLAILLSAIGTGVGAALGGLQGAGAGFLVTGAARNLYRAQAGLGSSENGESAKSLTLGVLGLAAGGYLVYRCFAKKKPRSSDDDH